MKPVTRRAFCAASTVAAASALAGCGGTQRQAGDAQTDARQGAADSAKEELVVFAAASLTESLTKIGELFAEESSSQPSFNFDSSGTLKTQIQEGAPCDVFISAAQKQMNQLEVGNEANTENLDLVEPDTRVNLLENKVVLVVPDGNPAAVDSFESMAQKLLAGDITLAMGNEDVPVGQYTEKILAYLKLDEKQLADAGRITYGSNVKEVTTQVSEAAVDCGIVYATDAYSAGLDVVAEATEEMCSKVVYPAAAIKGAAHLDEAKAFLEFCRGPKAAAEFEAVGFIPLSE
ncbi:molybdate ABC transporter substrate-binding protein [Atopobiaceae bacterium 24-176]